MEDSKATIKQMLWQALIFAGIVWTAGETPLTFALELELDAWHLIADGILSVIFIADVILHLKNSPLIRVSSGYSADEHNAGKKYRKSYWFPLDIMASIPFDIIVAILGLGTGFTVLRLLRLFRLIRIIKLFELFGSFELLPRHVRAAYIFFWVSLFVHWIACGWLVLTPAHAGVDRWTEYNIALYWAITTLTTIGYGDITPVSNLGRIYTMIIMITGVGLYGVVIGNFSKMLLEADRHKQAAKEKLSDLNLLMRHYEVPKNLQREVHAFYSHLLNKRISENDHKLISVLPRSLQDDLRVYMSVSLIGLLPLFSRATKDCLRFLATKLEPAVFSPGESIIKAGEEGHEMYIIGHGIVEVTTDEQTVVATLKDGEFFGEIALLQKVTRTANVRAKTYCDLYKLEKEDFLAVIDRFPALASQFKEAVEMRSGIQKKSA